MLRHVKRLSSFRGLGSNFDVTIVETFLNPLGRWYLMALLSAQKASKVPSIELFAKTHRFDYPETNPITTLPMSHLGRMNAEEPFLDCSAS